MESVLKHEKVCASVVKDLWSRQV